MKNGTNEDALPALIGDVITDQKHYIDNLFADTWKKLRFNGENGVSSRIVTSLQPKPMEDPFADYSRECELPSRFR